MTARDRRRAGAEGRRASRAERRRLRHPGSGRHVRRATAISGVNLEIYRNIITAVIGPSGCGKSTFIRCLNRMNDLVPSARIHGQVLYQGHDIYGDGVDPVEVRRRIGMVFQKANPFPKSIYDNVAWGPRVLGMKKDLDERVEKALTRRRSLGRGEGSAEEERAVASRAASSSGCALRARSRSSPTCYCWTSRPRRSTRSRPPRSRSSCTSSRTTTRS